MLLRATSDLHGNLPEIEACELLLIAGDIFPVDDHRLEFQRAWLHQSFLPWLSALPADRVVGVAGNHDFLFQSDPQSATSLAWDYLCDSMLEINGLRIWGHPWTDMSPDWAFHLPEAAIEQKLSALPECDLLLSHGPPLSLGDRLWNGTPVGSPSLLSSLSRLKPRALVCGHIHEAYGGYRSSSGAQVYNVSRCDEDYHPVNPVVEISL